ncbi:hypothetical protein ABRP78_12040, partial [Corynebacterium sp. KPL4064]
MFAGGDGGEGAGNGGSDTTGVLEPGINLVGAGNTECGDGEGDDAGDGVDGLSDVPGGVGDAAVELELLWVEVSRVLFLGICLDFHYFLGRVGFPK